MLLYQRLYIIYIKIIVDFFFYSQTMNQDKHQLPIAQNNPVRTPIHPSQTQTILYIQNNQDQILKRKRIAIKNSRVAKKSAIKRIQMWKILSFYSIQGENQWVLDRLYHLMSEIYEVMLNIFLNEQKERENIQEYQRICSLKTQLVTNIIRTIQEQVSTSAPAKILENVMQSLKFIVNQLLKQSMDNSSILVRQLLEQKDQEINLIIRGKLTFFYQPQDHNEAKQSFSDESFNPQIKKLKTKSKSKYNINLTELISQEQVQRMGKRLQNLKNQEIKNRLIRNIEKQLHYIREEDQNWPENSSGMAIQNKQMTMSSNQYQSQAIKKKNLDEMIITEQLSFQMQNSGQMID